MNAWWIVAGMSVPGDEGRSDQINTCPKNHLQGQRQIFAESTSLNIVMINPERNNLIKYFSQKPEVFQRHGKTSGKKGKPLCSSTCDGHLPQVVQCLTEQHKFDPEICASTFLFWSERWKWSVCLLRAKWFELMNTEEAEAVEEEEGHKRKREDKAEDAVKVKKIKLKVTRW